jgi:predicted cation transporter
MTYLDGSVSRLETHMNEREGKRMKQVIVKAVTVLAVVGAVALFGTSVKDLAAWKISGLDSAFMLNASIVGALLFSLRAQIGGPEEPPSIAPR